MPASGLRVRVRLLCAIAFGSTAVLSSAAAVTPGKAHQTAAAAVGQLRGVNLTPNYAFSPSPDGQSAADDAREIASACLLGAGVVREFVSWRALEPNRPGQVDQDLVGKLDSLMAQADRCQIKVIFTLLGTPRWDSVAPAQPSYSAYPGKDGPDQYRWMVSWILSRWPGLYAIEVWNEPNLSKNWQGTPQQYAELVNAAVAAKRAAGASTLILGGSLAFGGADYLRQLYADGMRGEDGISVHPYSMRCADNCAAARFLDPGSRRAPFRAAIRAIHRAMIQNGDVGGLWLTEFGFSTCPARPACISRRLQATWMARSIRVAACYPYVRGLAAFTLRDIAGAPGPPSYWDYHFGLMRPDFTPKPAFSAVRNAFRQLGCGTRARKVRHRRH